MERHPSQKLKKTQNNNNNCEKQKIHLGSSIKLNPWKSGTKAKVSSDIDSDINSLFPSLSPSLSLLSHCLSTLPSLPPSLSTTARSNCALMLKTMLPHSILHDMRKVFLTPDAVSTSYFTFRMSQMHKTVVISQEG